jgi:hypothetical protein
MSQKIKVTIECKQVVHFYQEVEIDVEDYEKIKDLYGDDVCQRNEEEMYSILESLINFQDVYDNDSEFTDVSVLPCS